VADFDNGFDIGNLLQWDASFQELAGRLSAVTSDAGATPRQGRGSGAVCRAGLAGERRALAPNLGAVDCRGPTLTLSLRQRSAWMSRNADAAEGEPTASAKLASVAERRGGASSARLS
jgi:hypothetical protein